MSWLIRLVAEPDLVSVADIVNHYIRDSAIHFDEVPHTADDWRARWLPLRDRYPWLVAERDGFIGGIAYARPWNARAAYAWTAESTVYIHHEHVGEGIGGALYGRLLALLDELGYRTVIAGITIPNVPSVRLHERLGFEYAGALERVGFKQRAWHDVGLWQRHVARVPSAPGRLRLLAEIDLDTSQT